MQLYCFDGRDSAVITTPDRRTASCLAFDPRSLGIATGLYSDLTLEENIAYHSGTDVTSRRVERGAAGLNLVTVELTDRFSQRIRFDVEPRSPFRVHYYSKTIPAADGEGIFSTYVTESSFWDDDAETWIPRKLVMYTLEEGRDDRRYADAVVEFEKPEFVTSFSPEMWTVTGLSLPIGQPLVDLRIKRRVGYWNGTELVESVPMLKANGGEARGDALRRGRGTSWLVVLNLVALGVWTTLHFLKRSPPAIDNQARPSPPTTSGAS